MSDKMTCPVCSSRTSSVLRSYEEGGGCPHCSIDHETMRAVVETQERFKEGQLSERYQELLKEHGKLQVNHRNLEGYVRKLHDAIDSARRDEPPVWPYKDPW